MAERKSRRLSREEVALWRAATRHDRPLPGRGYGEDGDRPEAPQPPVAASPVPPPVAPKRDPPQVALPELSHEAAPGLDRRTALRLRRGQVAIEDRLDLHGLTQERAHGALTGFIAACHEQGRRCVLVITGKGAPGEAGVLRRMAPRWLNEPPNRSRVLAFHRAQPRDGGDGALYVLLRRKR